MSRDLCLQTLRLEPTPRLAHTDYVSNAPLMREMTGQAAPSPAAFARAWSLDLDWWVNDGPIDWGRAGRVTDMGHAEFLEAGSDYRPAQPSPFTDVEQVLAFDAVAEYGLPPFDELVTHYERAWQARQADLPETLVTGGYYKTVVSGAIQTFGWEMLLLAAAEADAFARVLQTFAQRTLYHIRAWAQTSAPVLIQHDDMVWTEGAFLHPEFYRAHIFPAYAEFWAEAHAAGKLVLFCSDGDFTEFVDDLVAAGADGLIFEPMTDLRAIVSRWGQQIAIVGSLLDCRTLTWGSRDQIAAEIDGTLELARDCPGFVFAVGNHIPANVPIDSARFYLDYLRARWER